MNIAYCGGHRSHQPHQFRVGGADLDCIGNAAGEGLHVVDATPRSVVLASDDARRAVTPDQDEPTPKVTEAILTLASAARDAERLRDATGAGFERAWPGLARLLRLAETGPMT